MKASAQTQQFRTEVAGKWILAGEHAVIRGFPALVFPLPTRSLSLSFQPGEQDLTAQFSGEHGAELQLLFWGVLEKACELKKRHRSDFRGQVQVQSSIPVGAGLGASAALCVAVSRWLQSMGVVQADEISEFARQLENLFHGESSGVDIAVALWGRGLKFTRGENQSVSSPTQTQIQMNWQPRWYVSYSGKRGVTLECVQKVKKILQRDPELGQRIDEDMAQAVSLAETALTQGEERGFGSLVQSLQLANSCFERWGLTTQPHMDWLKEQGAVAVKPTGSGDGGYVLSLWRQSPSPEVLKKLIPCF
jgi:mevalonate kinase